MFFLYRWKRVRKFPTERIRFWNALASWKHFRKNKQLPLHSQKCSLYWRTWWPQRNYISTIGNKEKKKKNKDWEIQLYQMHAEADAWKNAILEAQVQINSVQSVTKNLPHRWEHYKSLKWLKKMKKPWIPWDSNSERIKHDRWQRRNYHVLLSGKLL